ncbi:hypothetical protein FFT09_09275 [Saccharomonospora piscinae]|uniref:hypothetical protein n=1 Tax=Saccharomonospora piscinae TaxID=687388 RepID=UPI0011067B59|nr:hypothetical protein [Saccharomonospora piscinae]TLW93560.1 hypothetical protein FFT09_09275 [Saccharomonospora piscinae]
MSESPRRHRGRQPRVPGGYPYPLEIRLTESDWVRLTVAAVRAEKADGAYASQLVRRGLAGEFDTVPADWRDVMAQLVAHRSALAGLRADIAAVGRLLNQVARALNAGGHAPAPETLARLGERVAAVLAAAEDGLVELDALTERARSQL